MVSLGISINVDVTLFYLQMLILLRAFLILEVEVQTFTKFFHYYKLFCKF